MEIQRVLISDSVDSSCVDILKQKGIDVTLKTDFTKEQLVQEIKNYDALIVRSATKVTADVLDAGSRLKVVGRAGTGVDNIDCDAATRNGILVINAPGGNTLSAAEMTCAMIISLSRDVPAACASLKSGKWDRKTFMGNELMGKTLAILGLGRIGKEVALRMQSFGMKTIGFDPIIPGEVTAQFGVTSMSLDEIWPQADYITVHTPLIPQTRNLISAATLAKCKKGVKIVNVARGGIINEQDLLDGLNSGHVSGAGLDVFEQEPPTNTALVQHPKVVCTPHLGANTKEAQLRVAQEIAEQFVTLTQGKSVPGVVNAPALAQIQAPENKPWSDLGIGIGKIAGALTTPGAGAQVDVTLAGLQNANRASFVASAVAVGLLRHWGLSRANFINVAALAEQNGIKMTGSHVGDGCAVTLNATVTSGSAKRVLQGRIVNGAPLLASVDGMTFCPAVLLQGDAYVGVGAPNGMSELATSMSALTPLTSISQSQENNGQACYLIGVPANAAPLPKTTPPPKPLSFWAAVQL